MKVSVSARIQKPAADVFEIISQFDKTLPKIDNSVISSRKLTEGLIGVGTRWGQQLKSGLLTMRESSIVTEFVPPERLAIDFTGPGISGHTVMRCERLSPIETQLSYAVDLQPRGFGWLLLPVLRMTLKSVSQRRIDATKRLIESGELTA